jgi:addiction module RelE/StbE family toxin
MKISTHDSFDKAYSKRIKNNPKLVARTKERVAQFELDPNNPILKDHSLAGAKKGLRAFGITGNYRIVYKPMSDNKVVFVDIGTHPQVY